MTKANDSGYRREQEIFLEAHEKGSKEEREAFLEDACGGDDVLRARVERLLENHGKTDMVKFLATPPGTISLEPLLEKPGSVIGNYKLLEKLGEGSFGVVYLAVQNKPVRRRVALKIIKPGMDSAEVIARFEAERQALALMEHEHIAKVFDAGATDTGRPYFVMELVEGVPLTDFCDRKKLSTRERLDLFIQVCAAVQHAHQKAIIHRDLKPSNILVAIRDDKPELKVIDFGVAKAISQELTARTLFTAHGQMVGTLQYMSPEQADMGAFDVDTRSDVYSLGVILYELLTGVTPIDPVQLRGAGYQEIQRIVREEEPPKPSTRLGALGEEVTTIAEHRKTDTMRLTKTVLGDLDCIVMAALEKDRARRYETATALAADVQRYLNGEVVSKTPPSFSYRLGKFVRKHKGPFAAAAVIAFCLVTGAGIAIVAVEKMRIALEQKDKALEEKDKALVAEARERKRAQTEEGKAWRERANFYKDCTPSNPGPMVRWTPDGRKANSYQLHPLQPGSDGEVDAGWAESKLLSV